MTVKLAATNSQPITNATVSLEGNMNHAGMAPVITGAVHDGDDGAVDGAYRVPFTFTMMGDWIITVDITQANGSALHQDIQASVGDAGVSVK